MTLRQAHILATVVMVVMIVGTLLTTVLKSSPEKSKVKECKSYAIDDAERPTSGCCKLASTADSLCSFSTHIHQACLDNFTAITVHQTKLLHLPSACNLTNITNTTNCLALAHLNATNVSTSASVGAGYEPRLVFAVQAL